MFMLLSYCVVALAVASYWFSLQISLFLNYAQRVLASLHCHECLLLQR